MNKYIRLFEETEKKDSKQVEIDSLIYMKDKGLISSDEYWRLRYDIDPNQIKKWHLQFEIDWDWAAQHSPYEIEQLIQIHDYFDADSPIFLDQSTISIDDWDETDYWESSEDGEELDSPMYGAGHYLEIVAYSSSNMTEEQFMEYAREYLGHVFSNVEVIEAL